MSAKRIENKQSKKISDRTADDNGVVVGVLENRTSGLDKLKSKLHVITKTILSADRNRRKKFVLLIFTVLAVMTGGIYLVYVDRRQEVPDVSTVGQKFNGVDGTIALQEHVVSGKDYKATVADYLILGNEYKRAQNYEASEDNYKKAESLEPANIDVLYGLADLYRLRENGELALSYLDKVIAAASDPNNSHHQNLKIYVAERKAIASGNFKKINIEDAVDVPL